MRTCSLLLLTYLAATTLIPAQNGEPPSQKMPSSTETASAYLTEMNQEWNALVKRSNEEYARTPQPEREALLKQFEQVQKVYRQKWHGKLFELASRHPAEPGLVPLLGNHINDYLKEPQPTAEVIRVLQLLEAHHLKSTNLDTILDKLLAWAVTPELERFLQAVGTENPARATRASALLNLAALYHREVDNRRTPEAARQGYLREAERMLEEIQATYADVKSSTVEYRADLGTVATRRLYELRNLVVGKPAPETTGTDLAGKSFKPSDYRGKVVVLDFWHVH